MEKAPVDEHRDTLPAEHDVRPNPDAAGLHDLINPVPPASGVQCPSESKLGTSVTTLVAPHHLRDGFARWRRVGTSHLNGSFQAETPAGLASISVSLCQKNVGKAASAASVSLVAHATAVRTPIRSLCCVSGNSLGGVCLTPAAISLHEDGAGLIVSRGVSVRCQRREALLDLPGVLTESTLHSLERVRGVRADHG